MISSTATINGLSPVHFPDQIPESPARSRWTSSPGGRILRLLGIGTRNTPRAARPTVVASSGQERSAHIPPKHHAPSRQCRRLFCPLGRCSLEVQGNPATSPACLPALRSSHSIVLSGRPSSRNTSSSLKANSYSLRSLEPCTLRRCRLFLAGKTHEYDRKSRPSPSHALRRITNQVAGTLRLYTCAWTPPR